MPTGYTAAVQDGTITDLRSFALLCARAFGALVDMRDERMDAPIPEEFKPHTEYHDEQLASAKSDLFTLNALREEDLAAAARKYNDDRLSAFNERQHKRAGQKARYDAMLAKVEAWQGGPVELKQFMISQLRESIAHDNGDDYFAPPLPITPDEWFTYESGRIARSIAYAEEEIAEEIQRTKERNAWLSQLRASLPPENA